MILNFFGAGSAFAIENNSAYFEYINSVGKKTLVCIDMPASSLTKIKRGAIDIKDYGDIYVYITHTHADHISGLPTFAEYCYYIYGKAINIMVPGQLVYKDIQYLMESLEGSTQGLYNLYDTSKSINRRPWFKQCIPVEHVLKLKDKCFGYVFNVDKKHIMYTGDTRGLYPFSDVYTELINDGLAPSDIEFYSEISTIDVGVHVYYEKGIERLTEIANKGTQVYLMHYDNKEKLTEMLRRDKLDGIIKIAEPFFN